MQVIFTVMFSLSELNSLCSFPFIAPHNLFVFFNFLMLSASSFQADVSLGNEAAVPLSGRGGINTYIPLISKYPMLAWYGFVSEQQYASGTEQKKDMLLRRGLRLLERLVLKSS